MLNLRRLLVLIRNYWKYLIRASIVSLILIIIQIPTPYFSKILIDSAFPNQDMSLLLFIVLMQFFLAFFNAILAMLRDYFQLCIGLDMSLDIGRRFFAHLEGLPFSFYDKRLTGDLLARFNDAYSAISGVVGILGNLFLSLAQLLFFPIILFIMNWKLTLLALLVYPLDVVIYREINKRLFIHGRLVAEKRAALQAKLLEMLKGIRTIQALGIETHVEEQVGKSLDSYAEEQLRLGRVSQSGSVASKINRAIGTIIFTWFGWQYVIRGEMSLGNLIAFTLYMGYLSGPILNLFNVSQALQQTPVHGERFLEIYSIKSQITDPENGCSEFAGLPGAIAFSGVTFHYEPGRDVLCDINAVFPAGKTTAIVGRSGAGKTTLVNLIPRFYDPSAGCIMIGNRNVKDYALKSLRSQIGYLMQSTSIFYGTIYSELTIGNPSFSMRNVEQASEKAYILEFIKQLPNGYDTMLGESAINLSVGQRQRLAIARLFLQNRPVLLLDEPTSALDPESEKYIQMSFEDLRRERTIIIIAHRLSTIESADQIIVMDRGHIVEVGDFETLMMKDGELANFYEKSASMA